MKLPASIVEYVWHTVSNGPPFVLSFYSANDFCCSLAQCLQEAGTYTRCWFSWFWPRMRSISPRKTCAVFCVTTLMLPTKWRKDSYRYACIPVSVFESCKTAEAVEAMRCGALKGRGAGVVHQVNLTPICCGCSDELGEWLQLYVEVTGPSVRISSYHKNSLWHQSPGAQQRLT